LEAVVEEDVVKEAKIERGSDERREREK